MGLLGRRDDAWREQDVMTLVPARIVASEPGHAPGQVVLLVPRYRDRVLGRWLQPRLPDHKRHVRIALESRGSFLWNGIDGRTAVGELCGSFAAAFPEDGQDVYQRVGLYLYQLKQNRFIAFNECCT